MTRIGISAYGIRESHTWEEIVRTHSPLSHASPIHPDDLMTIVYTSGTTGTPKGVMHASRSFPATLSDARQAIPFPERPRLFSYLSMSSHRARFIQAVKQLSEVPGLLLAG